MSEDQIRRQLAALRTEVRGLRPTDQRAQDLKDHLLHDLDGFLAEPSAETHAGLTARLQEGVETFETSHPQLTITLARIIDQLAAWNL